MSPRAAWRLETLGFGEVYDYVGSKMEWIGAGRPWEGTEASQPKLGDLAMAAVALCSLDDPVGVVRAALGQDPNPAAEIAERLDQHPQPRVLVTTLDGRLVGVVSAEDITKATRQGER